MIDVHVHLRDGIQSEKETLDHGMRTGASCGISAFFDMPNTAPPLTTEAAIRARLEAGRRVAATVAEAVGNDIFYGVYGGVTADTGQIDRIVSIHAELFPAVVGLKMFAGHSTGNMGLSTTELQESIYRSLARLGYTGVLAVHCEKESEMRPHLWDPSRPESHTWARGPEAEIASVADQIAFARESGFAGTLHIAHISTAGAIALVHAARSEGMRISCGATAHHALLDDSVAGTPGHLCKMNPPLRSASDRDAVFASLCDGGIDWIESDHAPHTLADKHAGASGIPGFAGTLLLIGRLRSSGVSERYLEQLCGARACQVFGIDLPVHVPTTEESAAALANARDAYPWDPFASIN
ncbi:MAG: dihydroorotase [Spirochaetae bacterium HGW-Spirochaetae-2]|jgi:dihydroorotase|nr:MAG: dihydroorotase [Spirochaetae bacterium HGW-Spirochaetae-2]